MDIKKLAVFGDSWIWGDELLDPILAKKDTEAHPCFTQNDEYRLAHCFSGIMAKHYGIALENYGQPGASLQSTMWTFMWWLNNCDITDTMVLIGLTASDRQSWYNPDHVSYSNDPVWNKYIHSAWVNFGSSVIPGEWRQFGKQYLIMSSCDQLSAFNYQQAVLFFDGVSKGQDIPLLQFNLYDPGTKLKQMASTLLWPDQNLQDILQARPDARQIHAPGHHPNEKGHQILSEMLIPEVDRAILA